MISEERTEELRDYFWNETNEEETSLWRLDLTEEELMLVESWDIDYNRAFYELSKKIVEKTEMNK